MKNIAALICLLVAAAAAPAFAHPGNDCATKAENIASTERADFIKSCLAQAGTPAKSAEIGQKQIQKQCDLNAKSQNLAGKKKAEYLDHCYHENDFDPKNKPHPKL
jgi:hypothetical protein